jgi:hypothetical protein
MDFLRSLQTERPLVFWALVALAFWLGFQLVLFVAQFLLGPFGLPSWAPSPSSWVSWSSSPAGSNGRGSAAAPRPPVRRTVARGGFGRLTAGVE